MSEPVILRGPWTASGATPDQILARILLCRNVQAVYVWRRGELVRVSPPTPQPRPA